MPAACIMPAASLLHACCMPAACLQHACCMPAACLLHACCLPAACLLPALMICPNEAPTMYFLGFAPLIGASLLHHASPK
jgi:hypothetical protein